MKLRMAGLDLVREDRRAAAGPAQGTPSATDAGENVIPDTGRAARVRRAHAERGAGADAQTRA
jgi:hypothetical protein